jgi:hypothetical protein
MKKIILIGIMLVSGLLIWSTEIKDPLWLKAVELKRAAFNTYPSQTTYISQTKDKKGNIDQEETIILSHSNKEGEIINSLVKAFNSEGDLSEDDDSVKRYLSMEVLSDDLGFFRTETSEEFQLKRLADESISGTTYAKYEVRETSQKDNKTIESEGYVWLDKETGLPLKMSLEVDPDQMVVKELKIDTYYSLSPSGFLQTDKVETNIIISLVFKKMYITQIMTRDNYQKLN